MNDDQRPLTESTGGQAEKVTCTVSALFAFRIGSAVELTGIEELKLGTPEVPKFKHKRRTPPYLKLPPAVVFDVKGKDGRQLIDRATIEKDIDVTVFQVGAVSIRYEIKFTGELENLVELSHRIQATGALLEDARTRAEAIMTRLGGAVKDPELDSDYEDYFIFDITAPEKSSGQAFLEKNSKAVAGMLRGEKVSLSAAEVEETLVAQAAYFQEDLVVIAWNSALLYGKASTDEALVLEFANVQLLLIRLLHARLEKAVAEIRILLVKLEQTIKIGEKFGGNMRDLRSYLGRVMRLQLDALFAVDAVTNSLELVGDQYLARVYRLAVETFAMGGWEAQIREKAAIVESAHDKLSSHYQSDHSHRLEWIVIILIVFEVIMGIYDLFFRH